MEATSSEVRAGQQVLEAWRLVAREILGWETPSRQLDRQLVAGSEGAEAFHF
jgi:hypothetical protein